MMAKRTVTRILSLLACCSLMIGAASVVGALPTKAAMGTEVVYTIYSFNDAGDRAWSNNKENPDQLTYKVVDSTTANGGKGLEGIDGKGIELTGDGGAAFLNYMSTPLDLSAYKDTTYAIRIRVYLGHFNWPNDNQDNDWAFEITSNGEQDRKSYRWGKSQILHDGWNEFYCPLTPKYMSLGGIGQSPDLSKINFMRFYSTYNPTSCAVLDDISIVKYTADPGPSAPVGDTLTLCDFDDMANVTSGSFDAGDKAQGQASAKGGSWNPDSSPNVTWKYNSGVDTGLTLENGAVKVWLYVKDLSTLRQTSGKYEYQFEMSSSAGSDTEELTWTQDQFTLKQGWNEYTLKFSDAVETGGECDLSHVNYVRFYAMATKATLVGMDDLRVINLDGGWSSAPTTSTPSTPETSTPDASTPETSTPEASAPATSTPAVSTPAATTSDAATSDAATGSQAEGGDASNASNEGGSNTGLIVLFVVIGVLILAAAGVAVYFLVIRKKPVEPGESGQAGE